MISLDMKGIYDLTGHEIDRVLPPNTIGNYVLGFRKGPHEIQIKYVGRSDTDLNRRLKDHLDEEYDSFMFNTQDTPEEAYIEECWNWHECNGEDWLDNKNHPDRPEGSKAKCPVCER